MFCSPCFGAIRVIISLRALSKISSSFESKRSLIKAIPFLYKNISLISSEKLHIFTIDITERAVNLAPFSFDLDIIEVRGSTRVMNSILPASPSLFPSSFLDLPKNLMILLQQASLTISLSLFSKIPTKNSGYS